MWTGEADVLTDADAVLTVADANVPDRQSFPVSGWQWEHGERVSLSPYAHGTYRRSLFDETGSVLTVADATDDADGSKPSLYVLSSYTSLSAPRRAR
jgi:hypothetical protein